jgi:hypothetical protein
MFFSKVSFMMSVIWVHMGISVYSLLGGLIPVGSACGRASQAAGSFIDDVISSDAEHEGRSLHVGTMD